MKIVCKFSRQRVLCDKEHELDLLVRLRAPAPESGVGRPALAIVPVVDVSGSMSGRKLSSVVSALERLITHLVPGDHVGLVTFDSTVQRPFPLVEVTEAKKADLRRIVRGLRAGSNTNLSGGLVDGLAMLDEAVLPETVRRRVVVLTDGLANEGPAVTRDQLVTLVTKRAQKRVSISAFGYGNDCDQALLGDVAQSGSGSYAYIENDDVVLSAFARELGGLLATYAREVTVRVFPEVPLGGEPADRSVRDLLFLDDTAFVIPVAVPAHGAGNGVRAARVEARFLDAGGAKVEVRVEALVDYVAAGSEDRADDHEVVRLRDEALLREAQEAAEARARAGDFQGARGVIKTAIERLRDTALLAFAREELLPSYGDEREYHTRSSVRGSSLAALRGTRVLASEGSVARVFGIAPSEAEREMETSFRGVPVDRPDVPPKK